MHTTQASQNQTQGASSPAPAAAGTAAAAAATGGSSIPLPTSTFGAPAGFGAIFFGAPKAATGFGFGFGAASSPSGPFKASSTPTFGAAAASPFGATSTAFGQGTSAFGQPTGFGAQPASSGFRAFGAPASGTRGTRVVPWRKTRETDCSSTGTRSTVYYISISCMPEYTRKSVEELRWEDYQDGRGTNRFSVPQAGLFPNSASSNDTTSSFFGGATKTPSFNDLWTMPATTGTTPPITTPAGVFPTKPPTFPFPSSAAAGPTWNPTSGASGATSGSFPQPGGGATNSTTSSAFPQPTAAAPHASATRTTSPSQHVPAGHDTVPPEVPMKEVKEEEQCRQQTVIDHSSLPKTERRSAALHTLVNWHKHPELEKLIISDWGLGDFGVEALSHAGWVDLQHLELLNCGLGPEGIAALTLNVDLFQQLRVLDLTMNNIGAEGVASLGNVGLPMLEELVLSYNDLSKGGAAALVAGIPRWPLLRQLDLTAVHFQSADLETLLSVKIPLLKRISLRDNELDSAAGRCLAQHAEQWPCLRSLDLSGNSIGSEGLKELSKAQFPILQALYIAHDKLKVDSSGLEALNIAAPTWPRLKILNLEGSIKEGVELKKLFKFRWGALEELCLKGNDLGQAGAEALANAATIEQRLPALKKLDLQDCGLDYDHVYGLLQHEWPVLEELNLKGNQFGHEEAIILADNAEQLPALRALRLKESTEEGDTLTLDGVISMLQGSWQSLREVHIEGVGGGRTVKLIVDRNAEENGSIKVSMEIY